MNRFSLCIILASATCFSPLSTLVADEAVSSDASGVEIVVDLGTEVGEMYNCWDG